MSVTLTCSCGAFVETEAAPGRTVRCPECDRPLTVPAPSNVPVRTSGLALASVVVALVGLFTVVLTVAAVVLGVLALWSIARRREELAGKGYAILGIVLGVVFTPLSLFAYSKAELFDTLRERLLWTEVDRGGPLEVVRPTSGYAITRPSERWGIARGDLASNIGPEGLLLANPLRDAYLEVILHDAQPGQGAEQCREEVLNMYRNLGQPGGARRFSGFQDLGGRRLPDQRYN